MKIRLFENHMSDFYQKVNMSIRDYNDDVIGNSEWFSDKEYKTIIKLIKEITGDDNINASLQGAFIKFGFKFRIVKMKDEWYYVVFHSNVMYKCDQFEGLEKFLRNSDEIEAYFSTPRLPS